MLDPETLYVILGDDDDAFPISYGRTPDGIGMYWYDFDQRDEAIGDVCDPVRTRHFDSHKEFDDYRDRVSNVD